MSINRSNGITSEAYVEAYVVHFNFIRFAAKPLFTLSRTRPFRSGLDNGGNGRSSRHTKMFIFCEVKTDIGMLKAVKKYQVENCGTCFILS